MSSDALILPSKLPEVEHWRDEPASLLPAALYSLVDLPDADLVQLQDACESQCNAYRRGECIRPALRWNFAGKKLEAIIKHHIEVSQTLQFDPLHFVVAAPGSEWAKDGVLFVTLDSDEDECVPDFFWVKADEAGLCLVNIIIGTSYWDEEKKKYALAKQ